MSDEGDFDFEKEPAPAGAAAGLSFPTGIPAQVDHGAQYNGAMQEDTQHQDQAYDPHAAEPMPHRQWDDHTQSQFSQPPPQHVQQQQQPLQEHQHSQQVHAPGPRPPAGPPPPHLQQHAQPPPQQPHDQGGPQFSEQDMREAQQSGNKVWVCNLNWWNTDQELEELCRQVGPMVKESIVSIEFLADRSNGKSKGSATIEFNRPEFAIMARDALHRTQFQDRTLAVTLYSQGPGAKHGYPIMAPTKEGRIMGPGRGDAGRGRMGRGLAGRGFGPGMGGRGMGFPGGGGMMGMGVGMDPMMAMGGIGAAMPPIMGGGMGMGMMGMGMMGQGM